MEDAGNLVPISALQHMLYCPRQCALIHVERQWAENRFTAEGRILHAVVEAGTSETRRGVRTERNVPLRSGRLGLFGFADVVEIHNPGRPFPIEYKRGRPKAHRADEVQLCAQALCLEEMLEIDVPEGALFYGKKKRRSPVIFDHQLRLLTEETARLVRGLMASVQTPPPQYSPRKCGACSLLDICRPRSMESPGNVASWIAAAINN